MKVHLKKDNSGAAMLTVVIAILFIVALGVALLSASYLGYAVTLTQEKSKANLYDAEAAMDDIRTGVHNAASNALADAYTDTLREYAKDNTLDPQTVFANKFVNNLLTAKYGLVAQNAASGTYSAKALAAFADGTKASTLTVYSISAADASAGSGEIVCTPVYDAKNFVAYTSFTLKNVKLVFIDKKNYETDISTDICISVPSFKISASTPHTAKEYSIIANAGLSAGAASTIKGNVFAGGIDVSTGGAALTFTGGDVISSGDVAVGKANANTSLVFGDDSGAHTLWAKGIKVTDGGSFKTQGSGTSVDVANDLSIKGSNCSVTLAGSYTGFGSETANNNKTGTADQNASSSILIGGKNTTLDMANLNKLTLAGIGFIDTNSVELQSGSPGDSIPMGQSVAVASDQLAYLVPASCLGSGYPTNPYFFGQGGSTPAFSVRTDKPLWPDAGSKYNTITLAKYLGAYQSTGNDENAKGQINKYYFPKANVEARYSQAGIAYVFLYFKDQSMANQYFKDYLAANPTGITQYLGYYLNGGKLSVKNVSSAGVTYSADAGSTSPSPNAESAGVSASGPAALYETKKISPYGSIVVHADEITGLTEFTDNGKLIAVATNDDFTYSSTSENGKYKDVKLILETNADKTVTVSSAFKGIVISNGNVLANASIDPTGIDWTALRRAVNSSGKTLSRYIGGTTGTTGTATVNEWDLDDLIVYKNWQKS